MQEIKSSFNFMLQLIYLSIANEEQFTLRKEIARQSLEKFG